MLLRRALLSVACTADALTARTAHAPDACSLSLPHRWDGACWAWGYNGIQWTINSATRINLGWCNRMAHKVRCTRAPSAFPPAALRLCRHPL